MRRTLAGVGTAVLLLTGCASNDEDGASAADRSSGAPSTAAEAEVGPPSVPQLAADPLPDFGDSCGFADPAVAAELDADLVPIPRDSADLVEGVEAQALCHVEQSSGRDFVVSATQWYTDETTRNLAVPGPYQSVANPKTITDLPLGDRGILVVADNGSSIIVETVVGVRAVGVTVNQGDGEALTPADAQAALDLAAYAVSRLPTAAPATPPVSSSSDTAAFCAQVEEADAAQGSDEIEIAAFRAVVDVAPDEIRQDLITVLDVWQADIDEQAAPVAEEEGVAAGERFSAYVLENCGFSL